jgi:hypothetical protein
MTSRDGKPVAAGVGGRSRCHDLVTTDDDNLGQPATSMDAFLQVQGTDGRLQTRTDGADRLPKLNTRIRFHGDHCARRSTTVRSQSAIAHALFVQRKQHQRRELRSLAFPTPS